jgi:hypothetical protein
VQAARSVRLRSDTLKRVASKRPSKPTPPARPQSEEEAEREGASEERYGPLTVARHAKDDGRALILYSHTGGGSR